MKILYIHQYFNTPNDAGGTRSYWFSQELIKEGHDVVVLTSNRRGEGKLIERQIVDGIRIISVKNPYSNDMNVASRLWSFFRFMVLSSVIGLRQSNIDLVYATSTPLSVGIPALLIKWFRGTDFLFEVRDLWPEVPVQLKAIKNKLIIKVLKIYEGLIYKQALHIVALSPGMKEGVISQGIPESKVSMIPNMAKKDKFFLRPKNVSIADTFGIDLTKFNAIHFGTMGAANGLDYIINAAKILKEDGFESINIIFLGSGSQDARLMDICKEADLDNVKFLGRHPMKVVSEIVNICDCSIVPFSNVPILYTNSPNKFFDSLSAGKAIIVNSAGWTKDIVEESNCGLFVDPDNPLELANVLIQMSNNTEWVLQMGRNSRRLAEEVYDKSILCKQFVEVIEVNHKPIR